MPTRRRRRPRPPQYRRQLTSWLTDDEHERLKRLAPAGQTLSAWVRDLVLSELDTLEREREG